MEARPPSTKPFPKRQRSRFRKYQPVKRPSSNDSNTTTAAETRIFHARQRPSRLQALQSSQNQLFAPITVSTSIVRTASGNITSLGHTPRYYSKDRSRCGGTDNTRGAEDSGCAAVSSLQTDGWLCNQGGFRRTSRDAETQKSHRGRWKPAQK